MFLPANALIIQLEIPFTMGFPSNYEDKHNSNYKLFCDGETCVQSDLQLSKHLVPNIHRWCDFFGMLVCVRSSMRENILSAKLA